MIESNFARLGALVSRIARIAAFGVFAALSLAAAPAFAQSADLVVNQADSPDPGPAGGIFTYTIRIDNNGPNASIGVNFSDTLPPGSIFVGATTTQGSCAAPVAGVLNCTLGDLAFLANATIDLQVILPTAGVWTNTASATSSTTDPNPGNNLNVAENTTAQNASDMTLNVVDSPDPLPAGASYNYAVTTINNGPAAAASQTVAFNVPTGACITATPTGGGTWACVPAITTPPLCSGTITCTRNTALPSGASAPVLTFPAVANVGGSIAAAFQVSSPLPDGNPANNTVTASTDVTGGSSDVSIIKTRSPAVVGVGANVVFTLTPRFNGGEPPGSSGSGLITVTDTLDAALTYVSHNAGAGWTCNFAAPTLTCTRPGPFTPNFTDMPAISITATVNAIGTISNTGSIAIPESDPIPANNSSTVTVTGSNSADMSIAKTAVNFPVVPGYDFNYTLTPRNNGPVALAVGQLVTVTDTIPAGITIRSAPTSSGNFWSCSVPGAPPYPINGPVTVTCTRTLTAAVNASTNLAAITIPVETNVAGSIQNVACVALSGAGPSDGNAVNNCNNPTTVISTDPSSSADLRVVSKTASPNPVVAGQDLTYTIIVDNAGPSVATNVTVTDSLLSLVNIGGFQSATTTKGTCTPNSATNGTSQNLNCALGTLAVGESATIVVVIRPQIASTGTRNNTATINSANIGDPNRANNSGSVAGGSTVNAIADLTVVKAATPSPVQAGTPLTYSLTVSNAGPSTAAGVTATDTLPINAAFIDLINVSSGGSCPTVPAVGAVGGTLQCTWPSIPSTEQRTAQFRVRPLTGASSVQNDVVVATTTPETSTGNNSATVTTPVNNAAIDLIINKVDSVDPVALGQMTKYTITVTNGGPSYATNVVMVDNFPNGSPTATFSYQGGLTVNPPGIGTCVEPPIGTTSGTLTCTFPGVANAQSAIVTYAMRAESISGGVSGTTFNTASVSGNEPETLSANNTTTHSTTSRQGTDLALTKSAPATAIPGAALAWTLTVTNNGPNPSTGALVTDTLPAGVSFASASPGCNFAAGKVTCTLGTLAPLASTVITINVTISDPYTGASPLVNSATVTAVNEVDTVSTNNTGSASTTVAAQADLGVAKVVNNATPAIGSSVTFTVTVTNNGPSSAANVQVTDVLPAGYVFVSAAPSIGSYDSGTGVWSGIGTLASGGSATMTITATVQPTGPYLNTATGTTSTADTNPNNNSAGAGISPVAVASLVLTKSDNSATYTPGGTGTYVVVVTNDGLSAAAAVTVSDTLPAGVTLDGTVTCVTAGSANCGSVTGVAGAGSFGATGASIAAGTGNSLTFTVPVAYASNMTADPLTNTATATDPASPPANGSDSSTRAPRLTLAVVKTDGSATYTPGGTATYQVTVTNNGPSDAANVTVTDTLPAGLTLTANVGCVANGVATCGTVTGSTGQTAFGATGAMLGAGATDSLVFTVPVAFAANMTTDPLVNTSTATDLPTGSSATGTDSNTLASQVSLAVVKTDGSATYTPGGTGTYVVTISNGGLSSANSVTVADALPPGVTLTAQATCVANGTSVCGVVTGAAGATSFGATGAVIVPGAGNTLVFTAPVAFAADMSTTPLVNTATATDGPSGATGSGSDSNARTADVTLVVVKTDHSATYTPGGTATYVVTVTNTGSSDALDVVVNDSLPPGVKLTAAATCVANGIATCGSVYGGAGQTTFGAVGAGIGAGAGNSLVFSAPVSFAANLVDDPLVNTAVAVDRKSGATGSGSDSNTLSSSGTTLAKSIQPSTIAPGGGATLTLTLGNPNPGPLTLTADFVDTMPSGVTTTSANSGSCDNVSVTVTQITMFAGATVPPGGCTIIVGITSSTPGTVTNTTGSLQTSGGSAPPASAPITVTTTPPATTADLAITKTNNVTQVVPGTVVTYTIVATNVGPAAVTGATVTDPAPAVLTGVTWTCVASAGSSCPASGNGGINAQIDLAVGGSVTFTLQGTLPASATGTLVNTASVAAPPGVTDPVPGNNTVTDSDPIVGPSPPGEVDLAIDKVNLGAFIPGQTGAQYQITVSNVGSVTSSGTVTVTDVLPAGLTATAMSGAGWACVQPAGPCTRSDPLAPGASYPVITLTVDVSANPPSPLINVVTVEGGGDRNGANNTAKNVISFAPIGPGAEPIPVDSPFALLLLMALLATLGAGRLRVRRSD
ncbi:MAG: DUF11 domain-containing protein [Burkholderiales bacterium]|nr:DUF11 domain-containing protein [Burkholderiales bacterium]